MKLTDAALSMKRLKHLQMSDCFLSMMLGDGEKHYRVVKDVIPADAVIVAVCMHPDGRSVDFLIQSNEFDVIEDDAVPPMLCPMLTDIRSQ